jgi:hypothetical protein
MGCFLRRILILLSVPVLLLVAVYFVTDPYKTLHPFSLTYFDDTNRDYLSSELFVKNYPEYHYNSYVFCSSRGGGINTYQWLEYLPEGSTQFLFQAWGETITGIDQKISYIDEYRYPLDNVLMLIDIPLSFSRPQLPTLAMSIKNPRFSHQPRWVFQMVLLYDFIQKPSEWMRAVRKWRRSTPPTVTFDPISNDWEKGNKELDLSSPPEKDNMRSLSGKARTVFLRDYVDNPYVALPESKSVIDGSMTRVLNHIKGVFERHGTNYRIIVTPAYGYKYPSITEDDLRILQAVFGEENVYDFSGRKDITLDYKNFSDPNHFGLNIGWQMLEEIFHDGESMNGQQSY